MPYADMAGYRAAVMMPWDLNLAEQLHLALHCVPSCGWV